MPGMRFSEKAGWWDPLTQGIGLSLTSRNLKSVGFAG